ncbi:hypothetical protein FQA39_LY00547 [Lamprigera yunnana]|nr:hypothetical protein FQA39_LY00547 [Lamprigera yunnana]
MVAREIYTYEQLSQQVHNLTTFVSKLLQSPLYLNKATIQSLQPQNLLQERTQAENNEKDLNKDADNVFEQDAVAKGIG